ncbi:MAG: hypothetical protein HDT19_00520 [Oscillibacter sp.]|nr:hypothetical protein [Oscillibacter sp.]
MFLVTFAEEFPRRRAAGVEPEKRKSQRPLLKEIFDNSAKKPNHSENLHEFSLFYYNREQPFWILCKADKNGNPLCMDLLKIQIRLDNLRKKMVCYDYKSGNVCAGGGTLPPHI